MVIRGARVISHLHDFVKEFLRRRSKLLLRDLFWTGNGFDERVHVERIRLVHKHDGDHQAVAHRGGRDGPTVANDDVHIHRTFGRFECFQEQIQVITIPGVQDIGLHSLNGEHPAEQTCQIPVLGLGEHGMHGLHVRERGRFAAPRGLAEFLLYAKAWGPHFDLAQGVNPGWGTGVSRSRTAAAGARCRFGFGRWPNAPGRAAGSLWGSL
jgi:hypothetical protein